MQVEQILHEILSNTIHQTRIKSLIPVINAIIKSKQLKLTQLGRDLEVGAKERSGIRRVDRLLSNPYYQKHAIEIYKAIVPHVICNQGRPIIVVDWTNMPNSHRYTDNGEFSALRASVIAEGRSITLYEEVHSKRVEGVDQIHRAFLKKLKSILPATCRPYIVTDAGFKCPWFKAVLSLNWDYVGRVRGKSNFNSGNGFQSIQELFKMASTTPKSIGSIELTKNNRLKTNCYLYKHKLQGRQRLNKSGNKAKNSVAMKAGAGYREPWVLVSSLDGYSAISKVIKIYKLRMTIEGSFRDLKSTEFGFSFNENKTIKSERYTVWLLISSLAYLIAWIVGFAAEQANLQYDFQANTYSHRRVLSFFYLGCRIIKKKIDIPIDLESIRDKAWNQINRSAIC